MRVPRLSIIVPYLGLAEPFEATLVSVLENRPRDCEVLVVHASCYDDPHDLGDEVRFVSAPEGADLLRLADEGFSAAASDVVHWLHCGLEAEEGWTEPILGHFEAPQIGAVSPLVLGADDRTQIVAAGVGYGAGGTRRVLRCPSNAEWHLSLPDVLGPTLLAAFYRKSALEAVGGLDAAVGDELADVDAALRIREAGYETVFEPASRVYSRQTVSPACGAFAAARRAERLFWRHARFQGWLRSLALHSVTVGAGFLSELPKPTAWSGLLGRGAAWLELMGSRSRERRRREVPRRAA